jgi:outer membrane autotransporter protein
MTNYGDWGGGDSGGSGFASTRSTLSGGETGYDWMLAGWRFGLATGYGYDNTSVQARTTSSTDAFWTASSYAAFDRGAFDVQLGATYSWHRLSAVRDVVFPGFAQANTALAHPSSGEAFGQVSWRAAQEGANWAGPFVGLSVDQVGGMSLAEAGGASALNVATDSRTLLSTRLGVEGQASLPFAPGLVAHGALDWRYASGDLVGTAHMVFETTGASFTVRGLPIAANAAEVTAGVSGEFAPNATLDVSYHAEAGDHFSDNAFKLAASWKF